MNIWHDISEERISAEDFVACIEISKGSKLKYELDKQTGRERMPTTKTRSTCSSSARSRSSRSRSSAATRSALSR